MHCKELVKGKKWVCVADGPRDPVTGERRQISRRGKTKTEATKKVKKAIEDLKYNKDYHKNITFKKYSGEWYNQYLKRGRKSTTNQTRMFSINYLNKYISGSPMNDITPKMYQSILNDLFDKGLSNSTIKMINNTAKMIFFKATEENVIKGNPTSGCFIPQKQLTVEEIESDEVVDLYLEQDELQVFLNELNNYSNFIYVGAIYLITFTGMRPGEAAALKEKDILFETSQVSITKTLYRENRKKGEYKTTPPKTMTSIRVVDLDENILNILREVIEYKKKMDYPPSEYLFATSDGHPVTVDLIRQVIRRVGEKTSIKKKLYTYIFRHTHISMLAEAGVSLPEIMKRVGHKNESTTTEIYLHVTKKMRETIITKMNDKFGDLIINTRNKE